MQKVFSILCLFGAVLLFTQCGSSDAGSAASSKNGITVSGSLKNLPAGNNKVYLDKLEAKTTASISNKELSSGGAFSFQIENEEPAIYRIRAGGQNLLISTEGGAKNIQLDMDFATQKKGEYAVTGSPASTNLQENYKKIVGLKMNTNDYLKMLSSEFPLGNAFLTYKYLQSTPTTLALHKEAAKKLKAAYPNSDFDKEYGKYILEKERAIQMASRSGSVVIGNDAPDIVLPNPKGEIIKLSSLKGKVVIVDFWASWCGPCRSRGNPELVKMYNKFKKEDFAIFNVALERGKNNDRWESAIKKDGLVWPYHVVDRDRKFSPIYGASRIPRTYVIDKMGKIAAINPHGSALESKVAELLKS